MLEKLNFDSFEFNSRKQVLIGVDATSNFVIKIEIIHNPNKTNNIKEEYEILKYLNERGSKTCPTVYELGTITKDQIYSKVTERAILDSINKTEFHYIIQQYIPDNGRFSLADIMLTVLEQRKLGVYQGDVKPANIRLNPENSVCYFIDYDQAIRLAKDEIAMDNFEFFKFCSAYDKKKYGIGNWMRHFPQYTKNDLIPVFHNRAIDLKETTIFNVQKTTNSLSGIYHSIDEKDIFIHGSRTVEARTDLLNKVEFKAGERVLDVGCNAGLLSVYLHDRGCNTTGVDNDSHIVIASKIIANILGKNIEYFHLDLDDTEKVSEYDTIMLFSVLHHTRRPIENAKKLIESCSRIILETRLFERGKQPVGDRWEDTTQWAFEDLNELVSFCEKTFEGFKLKANLGKSDKNRYMLEFVK